MLHYTYILLCSDNTLYTGYTNDLKKRVITHNLGKGAKYTRNRLPVKLLYWEISASKSAAMQREYSIKTLTRNEKILLINEMEQEIMEQSLVTLRTEINAIDGQLLALLNERFKITEAVGEYKKKQQLEIHNPQREAEVLAQIAQQNSQSPYTAYILTIWQNIMDVSKQQQQAIFDATTINEA